MATGFLPMPTDAQSNPPEVDCEYGDHDLMVHMEKLVP
jgi:hypothetical protein